MIDDLDQVVGSVADRPAASALIFSKSPPGWFNRANSSALCTQSFAVTNSTRGLRGFSPCRIPVCESVPASAVPT